MKVTNLIKITAISIAILSFLMMTGCSGNPIKSSNTDNTFQIDDTAIQDLPKEDISDLETEGLIFMREEEKLARDVYITLYEKWGMRIFNNISKSEQKHTNAIQVLLLKYELNDPIVSDSIGAFTNPILSELYTTLTIQGDSSLIEALKVGALIEEIDILDLQRELDENVDNEDIKYVYDRLLNGSYNHLRAFVRNLSKQGIIYSPLKLSAEQYQIIIGS